MTWIQRFNSRGKQMFYDGPAVYDYPGRRLTGYRSPNLMIAQWMHAFTVSHFTLSGRLLFLLSLAIFLAGMTALEMPIYYLSFTLVSLFVVDVAVGWIFRPKLGVVRQTPSSAPAGSLITLEYRVTNLRSIPAWEVYVETIPLPPPIHFVAGVACIPRLAVGETVTVTNQIQIDRRGRYFLPLPVADSAFPFGLWRWGSRGKSTGPLLIYPDYRPLADLTMPVGARHESGDNVVAAFAGDSMEFLGIREYRYGDNPRHIHAPSWARLRTPIVKEFRDESLTRASVVIDTYTRPRPIWDRIGRKPSPSFEATMSLAAAVCEYLLRRGYSVDVFVPGYNDLHLPSGRGSEQEHEVLELLAGLDENLDEGFVGLAGEHLAELHESAAAFVILQDWDAAREAFVDEARSGGVGVRSIVVTSRPMTLALADSTPLQVLPTDVLGGQVTEL